MKVAQSSLTLCDLFSRPEYWSGWPFLLQGIFPIQGSNTGLPHYRWIFYQLRYEGSPSSLKSPIQVNGGPGGCGQRMQHPGSHPHSSSSPGVAAMHPQPLGLQTVHPNYSQLGLVKNGWGTSLAV